MWKKVIVGSLIVGSVIFSGCTEDQRKSIKHTKSSFVGLKRTVTFYPANNEGTKSWSGQFKVELNGGVASFITDDGKEVKVSGSFVIQEN